MSNKFFAGNKGHYIFCDICGQACYDWEVTRLKTDTGRPGLLVCKNDADSVDYGLVPYTVPNERTVRWARINHQDVTNGSEPEDIETSTELGV